MFLILTSSILVQTQFLGSGYILTAMLMQISRWREEQLRLRASCVADGLRVRPSSVDALKIEIEEDRGMAWAKLQNSNLIIYLS